MFVQIVINTIFVEVWIFFKLVTAPKDKKEVDNKYKKDISISGYCYLNFFFCEYLRLFYLFLMSIDRIHVCNYLNVRSPVATDNGTQLLIASLLDGLR